MKILMVAPQPFFQPRGTPLSVLGRLKAISELGHQVDLVTYHLGKDVHINNVNIIRIPAIPFIKKVKVGPSKTKILLDVFLILKVLILLMRNRYDLLHSHEEAGFFCTWLSKLFDIPHLYDMHSSLPQQLANFKFTDSAFFRKLFEKLERATIQDAAAVITICPDLYSYARGLNSNKNCILIENTLNYDQIFPDSKEDASELRRRLNLNNKTVALYAGTFEPYQGLDLLIESAQRVIKDFPKVMFLLVGGSPDQVTQYKKMVSERGLEDNFIFTGSISPDSVGGYVKAADVLLSPRIEGTNTPLKIYSYLRSGKPIVATRHPTHTQVLSDDVAILTDCTSEGFAEGIKLLLDNPGLGRELAERAQRLSEDKYSYEVYLAKTKEVLRCAGYAA